MASVYLAQQRSNEYFQKWVAVKVIHPKMASDPKFVSMFMTEARLVARLDHPHICTVFDFGETDGTYFLAMEYLDGVPLNALFDRAFRDGKRLPLGLAARIVADVAAGLHAAHELRSPDGTNAGVVHRDVSPHNIFVLFGGLSKIVDFGVARTTDQSIGEMTTGFEIKGKLQYMSPEHLRSTGLDRRADVFALGLVLWEITTGRRLFKRASDMDTIVAVLQEPIALPSSVVPDYPAKLERIVMKALARSASDRYPTAAAMARDLEEFIASTGNAAGHGQVADFMEQLFADTVHRHTELLRRARDIAATAPAQIETFSFQSGIETVGTGSGSSPSRRSQLLREGTPRPMASANDDAPAVSIEPSRSSGRGWKITGVLTLVAAGVLAVGSARGIVHLPWSPTVPAAAPANVVHADVVALPEPVAPANAAPSTAVPEASPAPEPIANTVAPVPMANVPEAPAGVRRGAGTPARRAAIARRGVAPSAATSQPAPTAPATPVASPTPGRRSGTPSPMTEFE